MSNRFENYLLAGNKSREKSIDFQVGLAQLLMSITFDTRSGIDYKFVKTDKGYSVELYGVKDKTFKKNNINLSVPLIRDGELIKAEKSVYKFMERKNLLNNEDLLSDDDHIFWTALDYVAQRACAERKGNDNIQDIKSNIERKLIEINTFRKLSSNMGSNVDKYIESTLATIASTINYFAYGDTPDKPFRIASVNDDSFAMRRMDISTINKAVRTFMKSNPKEIDRMTSMTPKHDKIATCLAELNNVKLNDLPYKSDELVADNLVRTVVVVDDNVM